MADQQLYNAPSTTASGTASDIGPQINSAYYQKKALVEAAKETYFGQLADVTSMPKNFGKTIKRYHYLPLLDDDNLNDQGIDAAGVTILTTEYSVRVPNLVSSPKIVEAAEASFTAAHSSGELIFITDSSQWLLLTADTAIGYNAATAGGASGTEQTDAQVKALIELDTSGVTATVVDNVITLDGQDLVYSTAAQAATASSALGGSYSVQRSGNLYGSSKDVGYISGKLPALTESGGRVNRVGFKRILIEGSLEKFGFFDEYSQESLDFDTDAELFQHINTEMVKGANQITEAALQVDLLNAGTTIRYAGSATSKATITKTDIVDYSDIMHLGIDLDDNRTPKSTKVITGSRMVDTRTVAGGRIAYIGSELIPTLKAMTDLHGAPAFIEVQKYADAANALTGEIGSVDALRFVVVPEMQKWAGAGADASGDVTNYETGERYDVFPILVVGDESFTTIGFQTDGKTVKFKIKHAPPGSPESYANDPYGETGFMSIKWYYGFMVLRSERIGIIFTGATL